MARRLGVQVLRLIRERSYLSGTLPYASKGDVSTHLAIIATLMADMADAGIDFRLALRRGGLLVSESASNTGESNQKLCLDC